MKTLASVFSLLAVVAAHAGTMGQQVTTVAYLTLPGGMNGEDSAAVAWLKSTPHVAPRTLSVSEARLDRPGVDVLWIHIPDSVAYDGWLPYTEKLHSLATFYRNGGRLLLTGFGALVPHEIGIESQKPEVQRLRLTNDWLFDQKGFQGFRGHPVYEGLFGGVFTWDTDVDNDVYRIGYFGRRYPKEGKVVGIEKSYVIIESDNKLMIEYGGGAGRAMAIGGFICFGKPNAKRPHLEKFISNTIGYLVTGKKTTMPTYWLPAENKPRTFSVRTAPLRPSSGRELRSLPASGLVLSRAAPKNEFYDVGGRRALVMGRENGGIDELWVHPLRVLRDFRAGLIVADSVLWLSSLPLAVDVRPESFTRTYTTGFGILKEIVYPSLEKAGAVVHYEMERGGGKVSLLLTCRSDLRWMWPYDERALGDVYYGYDTGLHALHVKDLSGDFHCVIGADQKPVETLSGQFAGIGWRGGTLHGEPTEANQVYHASLYELGPANGHVLNVALVGTDEGEKRALADYRGLLTRPAEEYAGMVRHYDGLLSRMVTVESPEREFNALWKWTLVGVDRFVTRTPRLGTALTAGFSTVDRGWDGGHKISGRPGYAWYFGRDSEWSGFAIDDYGDLPTVREQLEFLQKYQDITGKIFHEVSTSGVVHYDASDATPLYIILAAHYLRASGDTTFLRLSWDHLKKAMDFLYSTDTDGDQLIENTNVGHGWVEGGKLWPVHTEFYLAGIWGQALDDAAWMASLLGKKDLAGRYGSDGRTVKRIVDSDFWNPSTQFYSYGKLVDGSYNPEPTVLPAPVMYFGWLDDAKVLPGLARYAGNHFTTDWGTRIVSDESPLFNPQGYHYGSIWPLFTGWTALADYEYGNSTQAFSNMWDNLSIKNSWALGYVEEVMNGAVYKPSGVCPHQCWSETNILHPGIHGMIGWKPRATERGAVLTPRFPLHWGRVSVKNLRSGSSVVDLTVERASRSTDYRLVLRKGSPVTIDLAPEIPEGMEIIGATLNGAPVQVSQGRRRGLMDRPIRVTLTDSAEVRLTHTGGVGVRPVVSRPVPGDSSVGIRIVGASLRASEYAIDVEGRSGTSAQLALVLLDQKVLSTQGCTLLNRDGTLVLSVPFDPSASRYLQKHVVVTLQASPR